MQTVGSEGGATRPKWDLANNRQKNNLAVPNPRGRIVFVHWKEQKLQF